MAEQHPYLAVCAVFRDETPYLPEWIEFHRAVGVEHFFLYDNFSQDDPARVLRPWIDKGIVSLTDWPRHFSDGGQCAAYDDCIETRAGDARWIAFLDIDEFLFSPTSQRLPDVLARFESHPGVVVNWQVYGTSNIEEKTDALVIERFVWRARTSWVRNRRVKSIVATDRARRTSGPHFFEYADGALAVTENQVPVRPVMRSPRNRSIQSSLSKIPFLPVDPFAARDSSASKVSVSLLRINHYVLRSRGEYRDKVARYKLVDPSAINDAYGSHHFRFHDRNEVHDPILHRYVAEVKRRLRSPGD
jgi:hypothetical protein